MSHPTTPTPPLGPPQPLSAERLYQPTPSELAQLGYCMYRRLKSGDYYRAQTRGYFAVGLLANGQICLLSYTLSAQRFCTFMKSIADLRAWLVIKEFPMGPPTAEETKYKPLPHRPAPVHPAGHGVI